MSEPLLERATHALRSTTVTSAEQLERGLERLERAERARRAPQQRRLRSVAWTLAATLAGAGAWAHATGRVHWFESAPAPAPAETPAVRTQARRAPRVEPARAAPVEPPRIEPAALEELSPRAPPPAPTRPRPRAPVAAPALPAAEPPSVSASDRADQLYREAHAAHFVRADYASALAAWDRYLAAAPPAHRWAVEARYNRGIALYRLGQTEAARRALQPFADGEYGSYRREEARRLLELLPRSD
jgi:hypothetical protein